MKEIMNKYSKERVMFDGGVEVVIEADSFAEIAQEIEGLMNTNTAEDEVVMPYQKTYKRPEPTTQPPTTRPPIFTLPQNATDVKIQRIETDSEIALRMWDEYLDSEHVGGGNDYLSFSDWLDQRDK